MCMKLTNLIPALRLTVNQKHYVSELKDPLRSLVICTGPAGTGKTAFACRTAVEQLKSREIEQLVITKPLITVGNDMGYLPGNIRDKMSPWIESYLEIFKEHYSMNQIEDMMKKEVIKLAPLAYCRGNTYSNSFVICDESQNMTPQQTKLLLTRMGEQSKLVLIGDLDQQDTHGLSGLADFLERYGDKEYEEIANVRLTEDDVCRSSLVKYILTLYK
jgi:phosphate starvation-inducible PhoH-like protein